MPSKTETPISAGNIRIRELASSADDLFFFEGEKLSLDLIAKGFSPDIILTEDPELIKNAPGFNVLASEILFLTERSMRKISSLKSPPQVISVFRKLPVKKDFFGHPVIFALDEIQDPGNMGTVFRCAAAFGIGSIALTGNCVNLNNRKFLRTAQDSVFSISVTKYESLEKFLGDPGISGFDIYLTSSHGSNKPAGAGINRLPAVIVVGNEGRGIGKEHFGSFHTITIPQSGRVESLNAGVTGCILMHILSEKFNLLKG